MEERSSINWALICHVAGLALYIGIPFGNILVPWMIWWLKKDGDAAVNVQGREAINFNLSFTLYGVLAGLLCYVVVGFVLLPLVIVAHIALIAQAILNSNKGQPVRYPLTLRFIEAAHPV
ncbi:MAG TPA: DUF4870 domain-containing protein [Elusimicrobiota bacterium]|nr:DUF4870 domain-containing protein [Elusimicrobiota bacterium]